MAFCLTEHRGSCMFSCKTGTLLSGQQRIIRGKSLDWLIFDEVLSTGSFLCLTIHYLDYILGISTFSLLTSIV